ncbi:membrane-bound lytic murein transglycosylase A [Rhodobacter viridis]|uniref:peptidoglycan lytic exotransglycosylase n=1 Tax=Rhodobacter viridis TaxID=1054202 RepID=A0A318U1S3_9RHOB|nr:MltA domain-containing protein [Rhodobacter viridis]PYF11912.1 membrane-bound lytic murein transglycosylase A [Rhodobacter viridis]
MLWSDLPGWANEDHAAAWAVFATTADLIGLSGSDLAELQPRARFETLFEPVEIVPPGTAHFTAYYEPELLAARACSDRFPAPLHRPPPDFQPGHLWHGRAEISRGNLLTGHEIAFVESAIEAFLAQVQGSVRLRFEGGSTLRLGFAGKNGHPYRSIGAELIRRGIVSDPAQMTPEVIRRWCAENPEAVADLLETNPSYVFFRPLDLPEGSGPLGATGRPVTAERSLAVDPEVIALGTPVWIDCPGLGTRLLVAQDIGSAIKGPGRGDIFLGSGPGAGARAGAVNTRGRMVMLRRRS